MSIRASGYIQSTPPRLVHPCFPRCMTDSSSQNETDPTISEAAHDAAVVNDDRARVMCSIMLDRLKKQDVVWIRIADPQVRRVDDLQIATGSRIDAYLLRWNEWADKLTLEDLISEGAAEASLIKQLADGWLRLKAEYHSPIFVHLLTNDQPSPQKIAGSNRNDYHLAKFLAFEWKKNKQDDSAWSDVWNAIRTASGLSEVEFEEFVGQCRFDCSYAKPELDEDADGHQPYYWVEHIYDLLFEHEDHALPIELNQAELLQILNWRGEHAEVMKPRALSLESVNETASGLRAIQENEFDFTSDNTPWDEDPAASVSVEDSGGDPNSLAAQNAVRRVNTPPASSLSSLRSSAAAGWLEAADDSGSEVASWLKTGGETGPLPVLTKELHLRNADAEPSEERRPPTSFIGSKQGKEKKGWKDLAAGERQQSGSRRRFNESGEGRTNDAESQRTTGKLRQMLGSRGAQPAAELAEDADAAEDADPFFQAEEPRGQHESSDQSATQDIDPDALQRSNKRIELSQSEQRGTAYGDETFAPTDETIFTSRGIETETADTPVFSLKARYDSRDALRSLASDPEADKTNSGGAVPNNHTDNSGEAASYNDTDDSTDAFAKISRLGRMQDGNNSGDEAAARDAFEWYFNNANEMFEANRFEDAALEYTRALELLNNLPGPNHDHEFLILQNLGDIYMFLDQPDQAVELYERTKQQHFNAKIPAAKYIAALIKLGTFHEDNNCFGDAEKEYRKAIEIAAEFLPKDDPILVRLNDACLNLARNRSTLMSRFSSKEVERIREMAKQEVDVAIMYRKKKATETDTEKLDIWRGAKPDAEEEEPVQPPSPKNLWIAASVGVVILFIFAYAMLVPHSGTRGAFGPDGSNVAGTYSSTDAQKTIELSPSGDAIYNHNGTSEKASFSFVGNSIQDLIPLIPGHLRSAFTFFRAADDAIVDNDGTYFYTQQAPETVLVKRMWKTAELAQSYRAAKSFYPESEDVWAIAKDKLTFTNPVTRGLDQAIIFSTTGESTDTPMRKSMAAGELWEKQPQGAPGRIICNVYNGRMFFIRGFDRYGKMLTSADKGKYFYIECSDGIDVTKDKLKELYNKELLGTNTPETNPVAPQPQQKSDKKIRFIFASSPDAEANLQTLLSAVPGILFALVLVSGAVWRYRVNKKIAGPFSLAACILSIALLLAWYVVGILDIAH